MRIILESGIVAEGTMDELVQFAKEFEGKTENKISFANGSSISTDPLRGADMPLKKKQKKKPKSAKLKEIKSANCKNPIMQKYM